MAFHHFKIGLILLVGLITGCGATHTAIHKRNLEVQTKMSDSIFLDPVPMDKRSVYVQVRNTSDKPELDLESQVRCALEAKGYALVTDPEQAHYLLQANVLQVGKTDLRTVEKVLDRGFGAAIGGAIVGVGLGSLGDHRKEGEVIGGILGAAVSTVTDAVVEDVAYCVIADLQISEKVGNTVEVKEKTRSKLKQGSNGIKEIIATEKVNWKRYQTRIVSTANKVNLKFEKAAPELTKGLSRSIVGVF